jgi:hypothetical protein
MEGAGLIVSRVLFLRVSAQTYDEGDVPKNWPMLYMTVWPDSELAGVKSPAKLARNLLPAREHGVLELASALADFVRYGDAPDRAAFLKSGAEKLEGLRGELDAALGNRDVRSARKLCDAIEETLDDMEKTLRVSLPEC